MSELIARIRRNLTKTGGSEVNAFVDNAGLKSLWQDRQSLLQEMNAAKKAAAEEAAKPYLELIEEVDMQYAMLLQMISGNNRS